MFSILNTVAKKKEKNKNNFYDDELLRRSLELASSVICLFMFVCFNEFSSLNSCLVQWDEVLDIDWVYWLQHLFSEILALLTFSWKLLSSTLEWGALWAVRVKSLPGPLKRSCLLCLPEQSSGDRAMWSWLLKIVGQEHLVTINIGSFFQPSLWSWNKSTNFKICHFQDYDNPR